MEGEGLDAAFSSPLAQLAPMIVDKDTTVSLAPHCTRNQKVGTPRLMLCAHHGSRCLHKGYSTVQSLASTPHVIS